MNKSEEESNEDLKSSKQRKAVLGNLDKLIASEKDPEERKRLLEARKGILGNLKKDSEPEKDGFWKKVQKVLDHEI